MAKEETKKQNNILMLPFLGIANIFKLILDIFRYALKGLSFCTIDLFGLRTKRKELNKTALDNGEENHVKKIHMSKKQLEKLEKKRSELAIELQNEGSIRSKTPQVFWYRALNKDGKMETGTINGYSKLDVNTFLLQESYTVYEIKSNKYIDFLYGESSVLANRMSNKDLLFWLAQLSTYLESGIPLTDSVKILNNQMKNKPRYKKAFQSIVYELTMGQPFSRALEKQGSMFPPLLINMIRAAEATGELEATLKDMSNYYEEVEKTRKQMISAITYPAIITVFAVAVITFILMFIIPEFIKVYEENDSQISGLTLFIVNASNFLRNNIFTILGIILIVVIVFYFCYKYIKTFRRNVQYVLMHLPIVSKVIIYKELTIFTKTFSSLLFNNVFITDSMDILSRVTNNEIYKEIMEDTVKNIVKGDKISTSFKNHWAIPDVAYYMIVTGESTGQLAEMMKRVSNYYAEMHRSIVTNLKSFIEPVLISLLAIVVGIIILAVIVPMFNLLNEIE